MGRKRSFAHVTSTNALNFDFPYQGNQHGTLTIRKTARWGTEVLFRIERGQFLGQFGSALPVSQATIAPQLFF
jgi:hypothetical protein